MIAYRESGDAVSGGVVPGGGPFNPDGAPQVLEHKMVLMREDSDVADKT